MGSSKLAGSLDVPGGSSRIADVTPPPLSPDRPDGYGDGYGNVFQGVRVYDPTMAQWTAPDAYSGDVHDPMSQKPFMWNGNNPLDFEDPTGYCIDKTNPSRTIATVTAYRCPKCAAAKLAGVKATVERLNDTRE